MVVVDGWGCSWYDVSSMNKSAEGFAVVLRGCALLSAVVIAYASNAAGDSGFGSLIGFANVAFTYC